MRIRPSDVPEVGRQNVLSQRLVLASPIAADYQDKHDTITEPENAANSDRLPERQNSEIADQA
jgi:hypothetical protein